ncbi:MAG: sulfatase-like hydrolase/transferase [Desulfobacterales bacterium]|nr:sulfatase-like hydrolase/transferase [Desulfobacterales bacterium]
MRQKQILVLLIALAVTLPALAQEITGVPGSPSATTTISGKQLPPPDPKFGGVIKEKASESKAWWPPRVVPPKGAPNVLLIMTDDAGFGAPSTFGGVIPTPALDRIAKSGLRYTNFHSTSLCSPTRAALITGRNHHSAGFGVVGEIATGFPGYDSIIPIEKGTIGTILKDNGYATSWFGKDHNTPFFSRQPGRAVRPVAERHGLRVLLRLRRRRRQPVAAEPVPQHDADLSRSRASPAGT